MARSRRTRHASTTNGTLAALDLENVAPGQPKHERLRCHLAGQITSGQLQPGAALPTELELAQLHGVARSTVRQALAALERDELIRRVHGKGTFVHERAGYRPRRGLDLFALVLPETRTGFYPALQHSFEQQAALSHHQMLVCCTDNNVDRQGNIILQLLSKPVGGVALVPAVSPPTPAYQVRMLQQNGIPVVFCHRRIEEVSAPLLAIPYQQVGVQAGEAVVGHGHGRAAFFALQRSMAAQAYETGLRSVLESAGGSLPEEFVHRGAGSWVEMDRAEVEFGAALEAMLASAEPPTAIFASFDPLAELLYLLLRRQGWRVPEDVSLVGVGGTVRDGALQRQLTSVTVDEVHIGRQAAVLLDRMRRGDLPLQANDTEVIPIGLSDGQTLGPAPPSARRPPRSGRVAFSA